MGEGWRLFRYEQLKAERTKANLEENPEMTSLMEKIHRFIYDDICEVEENVMVSCFCIVINIFNIQFILYIINI